MRYSVISWVHYQLKETMQSTYSFEAATVKTEDGTKKILTCILSCGLNVLMDKPENFFNKEADPLICCKTIPYLDTIWQSTVAERSAATNIFNMWLVLIKVKVSGCR